MELNLPSEWVGIRVSTFPVPNYPGHTPAGTVTAQLQGAGNPALSSSVIPRAH